MKIRIKKSPAQNTLLIEGDKYKTLSSDGVNLGGKSHKKGGTVVSSNGEVIEAESNEPIYTDSLGENYVFGNVENPISKTKFKTEAKNLLKEKGKIEKNISQANNNISELEANTGLSAVELNTNKVKIDLNRIKEQELKTSLDNLAYLQEDILNISESTGQDPNKVAKRFKNGGKIKVRIKGPKFQDGGAIEASNKRDYIRAAIREAARSEGVDPNIYERVITAESSLNPKAKSPTGNKGLVQFSDHLIRKYGLSSAINSENRADIDKVLRAGANHFKELVDKAGGDTTKALIMYNAGEGAINRIGTMKGFKDEVGKPASQATGDEIFDFLGKYRQENPSKKPSAYQNETYNYVSNIAYLNDSDFYNNRGFSTPGDGESQASQEAVRPTVTPSLGQQRLDPSLEQTRPISTGDNVRTPIEIFPQERLSADSPEDLRVLLETRARSQDNLEPIPDRRSEGERNRLTPMDFLPEIRAILDRPDYVQGQQYDPTLYQDYRVSFQDQINQNTATFNALSRSFSDNPAALATLAGQRYQQDQQVLANEFRANQEISNRVNTANVQLLNQAQLQNIGLSDLQYQRQEQARAITEQNRMNALNSISDKYAKNRQINRTAELIDRQVDITQRTMAPKYFIDSENNVSFDRTAGDRVLISDDSFNTWDSAQRRIREEEEKKQRAEKKSRAAYGYKFKYFK